ncbi:helix-turn-helix domain-containing protein [Nonomuraea sp. NPDC050394]|uniref:helix-turn-helix domain-containing protein n=1 Tax=Nonomuraea sp. NPDC050394 TaxID=3364363 RepID=UPI0037A80D90
MTATAEPPGLPEPSYWPGEVAAFFRVDARTVRRWANDGKLRCIFTPGGHRRFPESAVRAYLGEQWVLPEERQ